jgi:toxin ParE1/3/4
LRRSGGGQVAYIGERNLDAAERFLVAAEETFLKLAEMPQMGRLREFSQPHLADIRSWPIRGFENYLIFYRAMAIGIDVLRVIHGARDIDRLFE